MSGCVFCSIVAGETAADVVHEDDDFVAFLDRRPVFKGHTLLVPRDHVETLPDLPAALRDRFLALAQRLATAMKDGAGGAGQLRGGQQHGQPVGAPPAPARRAAHQGRRAAGLLLAAHDVRRRGGVGSIRRAARCGPRVIGERHPQEIREPRS